MPLELSLLKEFRKDTCVFMLETLAAAAAAGAATPEQIDGIVKKMIEEKTISLDKAKELLEQI